MSNDTVHYAVYDTVNNVVHNTVQKFPSLKNAECCYKICELCFCPILDRDGVLFINILSCKSFSDLDTMPAIKEDMGQCNIFSLAPPFLSLAANTPLSDISLTIP